VRLDLRAAGMLTLSTPANQLLAMAVSNSAPVPTRVLVLMNTINLTDFPGDKVEEEYNDLVQDMRAECSRYGNVLNIVIPRPSKKVIYDTVEHFSFSDYKADMSSSDEETSDDEEAFKVPGIGKVFVEYDSVQSAELAHTALRGRSFDGRMVITSFHSEEKWAKGVLDPDPLEVPELSNVTTNIAAIQQQADKEVLGDAQPVERKDVVIGWEEKQRAILEVLAGHHMVVKEEGS